MPFLDEPSQVKILDYQARWPQEFRHLAAHVRAGLGSDAVAIDHVGSASVPGLAAKDVIDLQVRVTSINEASVVWAMNSIGFRCRPEAWNKTEMSGGVTCRKLVFAPPAGQRLCNVHFREAGAPNTQARRAALAPQRQRRELRLCTAFSTSDAALVNALPIRVGLHLQPPETALAPLPPVRRDEVARVSQMD